MAQIGAAIGREFSHELIAAVSALAPMDLDAALERLTASGLISRRGTPPDATYSFKHALVQDAAYATMLKSRRRQLHASIAKVLVERFPAMAESQPEVVAHHFTEAGLASEAIGYWLKAGRLAQRAIGQPRGCQILRAGAAVSSRRCRRAASTLEQGFDLRLELRPVLSPARRSPADAGVPARGRGPRRAAERRPPARPGLRVHDEHPLADSASWTRRSRPAPARWRSPGASGT